MPYKILSKCPVCGSNLKAIKLRCSGCGTVVENEFFFSKFEYLNNEQLNFIEIFLKCRGNIKDVERELKISYPTVRAKLDDVIEAIGYKVSQKEQSKNSEIVDMLEKGEITPDEALKMIHYKEEYK